MTSTPATPAMPFPLAPVHSGWQLALPDAPGPATAASPAEAVGALAAETPFELALPTRLALLERFTLPSHDHEELDGMVALQLEKRLPYPMEEVRYAFRATPLPGKGESREGEEAPAPAESHVIAAAVHLPRLDALCEPLLAAGHYPSRLTFQALRIAETVQEGPAIWWEESQLVFAWIRQGAPVFIELLDSPAQLCRDIRRLLLGAELSGAAGGDAPARLWLDPALEPYARELADAFTLSAPPDPQFIPRQLTGTFPDLAPPSWRAAVQKRLRRRRLVQKLKIAGVAAIGIAAAAFLLLAFQRRQLRTLEAELTTLRPQAEGMLLIQSRWKTLAPAIERDRYPLEILQQISAQLPSPSIRITAYTQTLSGFRLEGEAPSAKEAVDFIEKLKALDLLSSYELEAPPPTLLPTGGAQFILSGK